MTLSTSTSPLNVRHRALSTITNLIPPLFFLGFASIPWVVVVIPSLRHGNFIGFAPVVFFILWSSMPFITGIGLIYLVIQPSLSAFYRKLRPPVHYLYDAPVLERPRWVIFKAVIPSLGMSLFTLTFASLPWLFVGSMVLELPLFVLGFMILWSLFPALMGVNLLFKTIVQLLKPAMVACQYCGAENITGHSYCKECGSLLQFS
ncbi:MAG: hypothetical protein ACXAE3_08225 [Candidatus Kariarchaeaceae archaeon]|jgi:hypothetical protein